MTGECSVNFRHKSLPTNEWQKYIIHQQPMQTAAIQCQSQMIEQKRLITVRCTRNHRLISLLAAISKILIIAYTITASTTVTAIAAANGATASAASIVTWPPTFFQTEQMQCPSLADIPTCPCYKSDNGNKYVLIVFRKLISFHFCEFAH